MQLKEGSYVNILGRLDEDVWEDQTTHEKKSAMVVIVDEIEYCFSNTDKKPKENDNTAPNHRPPHRNTPVGQWQRRRKLYWI